MKTVNSPMAGNVWKILVKVGDAVAADQDVAILESMKMEIPVISEHSGKVAQIHFNEGDFIDDGAVFFTLE